MTDSMWQLQKSAYAALSGDATLGALVEGVFDFAPQETAYPFVLCAATGMQDFSTRTTRGSEVALQTSVFTREHGAKNCLAIVARIHDLLHDADLTVTGHSLIALRLKESQVSRRPDGITTQGVSLFSALVEES